MHSSPRLEALEDRVVPAFFGTPWSDASQLTVSFVNDDTPVDSRMNNPQLSNLFARMEGPTNEGGLGIDRADWQEAILRAVQTWLQETNVNVRVVEEAGTHALGTDGALQGDTRFGDIRIAGAPLGHTSIAVATPYDPLLGTWSGDIVFNTDTNVLFSTDGVDDDSYDLFSIALHEVGHALGLAGNLDRTSAMFDYYDGVRTGLSAADVTAVQRLYGSFDNGLGELVRDPDRFDKAASNETDATATKFMRAARQTYRANLSAAESADEASGLVPLTVAADLGVGDTDWYWYRVRAAETLPAFSVSLRTNETSMARLKLTIYDHLGAEVANFVQQGTTNDGLLTLDVTGATAGTTYYFKVEAAGDDFAVGSYLLQLVPDPGSEVATRLDRVLENFTFKDDDTTPTAVAMKRADQSVSTRPTFTETGTLFGELPGDDVDVYTVTSPNKAGLMQVTLSLGTAESLATVSLYTFDGVTETPVAATVVASGFGTYVLEATYAANTVYYVAVANPYDSGDSYRVTVQFKLPADPAPEPTYTGTLADGLPEDLTEAESGLTPEEQEDLLRDKLQTYRAMELVATQLLDLSFTNNSGTASLLVQVVDNDSPGTVLYEETVAPGSTARVLWLLGPGSYTFRFAAGVDLVETETSPLKFEPFSFSATLRVANDPIGPEVIDPSNPPPRQIDPVWSDDPADVDPGIISILRDLATAFGKSYGDYRERWY